MIPAENHQDGWSTWCTRGHWRSQLAWLKDDKGKGLIALYNSLVGGYGADGARLLSEMHGGKSRGNASWNMRLSDFLWIRNLIFLLFSNQKYNSKGQESKVGLLPLAYMSARKWPDKADTKAVNLSWRKHDVDAARQHRYHQVILITEDIFRVTDLQNHIKVNSFICLFVCLFS